MVHSELCTPGLLTPTDCPAASAEDTPWPRDSSDMTVERKRAPVSSCSPVVSSVAGARDVEGSSYRPKVAATSRSRLLPRRSELTVSSLVGGACGGWGCPGSGGSSAIYNVIISANSANSLSHCVWGCVGLMYCVIRMASFEHQDGDHLACVCTTVFVPREYAFKIVIVN